MITCSYREPRVGEPGRSTRQLVYFLMSESAAGRTFEKNGFIDYRLRKNIEVHDKEDKKKVVGGLLIRMREMEGHAYLDRGYLQHIINDLARHYRGAYGCLNREEGHRCQACEKGEETYPILIGEDYWANNHLEKPRWAELARQDAIGRKNPNGELAEYVKGAFTV